MPTNERPTVPNPKMSSRMQISLYAVNVTGFKRILRGVFFMVFRKLFVLLSAFLLLGCIGGGGNIDAVSAAKTSGQIQAFLQEHPNAKIVVLLLSDDALKKELQKTPECAAIGVKSAYQVTFTETSTTAVTFVSPDKGQVLCAVVNSSGGAPAAVTAQASATSQTSADSKVEASVKAETKADVSGITLSEYTDEEQGFRILKPEGWDADVIDDAYLLVQKDENTDALIWPIKLQGKYASMDGVDLGNYIIGLSKDAYPSFKTESIHLAPDKTSMQVIATVKNPDDESVTLKVVFTSFVDAQGNGLLSGYEAPVETFAQEEAVLRKIVASYVPIVTAATKAAVGPAPAQGSDAVGASVQLVPYTAGDGGFSFNAPSGWTVNSLGACSTKSMTSYDPQRPVRRVFAIASNTYAIAISQPTAASVITDGLGAISRYDASFTAPSNIQLGAKEPYPATQGVPNIADAGVYDVSMTIDGQPVRGRLGAYVLDPTGGYGGYAAAYYISLAGILTDAESYDAMKATLDQSIKSFAISQSYANACTAAGQADSSARSGDLSRTLSETSDIITGGYNERSAVQDRVAQKWSDTTLGYDRVYNPDSDQVYRVPNDFYDQYDVNRQSFEQQNLQQLTPDQWNQYAPLDGELNIR